MKFLFFYLFIFSNLLFAQQNDSLPIFYLDDIQIKTNPLPEIILSKTGLQKETLKIPASKLNIVDFNEALEPVVVADRLGAIRTKKIGFVNRTGKFIIPFQYDKVYQNFKMGFAIIGKKQNFVGPQILKGVIDKKNKKIVPLIYDEIGKIAEGIIPVKNASGLWGFYTIKGKVFDCIFEEYVSNKDGTFSVNQNGKWGVLNETCVKIIEVKYKSIENISADSFLLEKFNTWIIKDRNNKKISELEFDSISPISDEVYKYQIKNKYGLVKRDGTLLTKEVYERIRDFKNNVAVFKRNGKYGLIKNDGAIILPAFYSAIDFIDSSHVKVLGSVAKKYGHYAKIFDEKKWGIFTTDGEEIYPIQYSKIETLSENFLPVLGDKQRWGYVNLKGDTVIGFDFNEAENFKNGLALVTNRNGIKYYINKKGKMVVDPLDIPLYKAGICNEKDSSCMEFFFPYFKYENYVPLESGYVIVKNKSKYGALNRQGLEIIPPIYDSIDFIIEEEIFSVRQDTNKGMIDRYGRVFFLNNKFEKIFEYSDGLYKVMKDGHYGFIDKKGIVRISIQYPEISDFREGFASAVIKGKWGFINKHEELIVQPFYTEAGSFRNGVAAVKMKDKKWNLIDAQGKELHSINYDEISKTDFDKWIIVRNGKMGLTDSSGREIIGPKYDNIKELGNGLFKVWKSGRVGVLDKEENFVLPIEFDNLEYDMLSDTFIIKQQASKELKVIKAEEK